MSEELSLEELASLPEFYHPVASPDGEKVAFYWDKTGRNELHVFNRKNGEISQISKGNVPKNARWPIIWHPNGNKIYFHKDEAGNEQNDIHLMDMDGSSHVVVQMDGRCVINEISSDGRYLLLTSNRDKQMNLFVYDSKKEEVDKLTEYDKPVCCAKIDEQNEKIAYAANDTDDLENADVYLCDIDGSNKRKLEISEEGYRTIPVEWSPDVRELLVKDTTTDKSRAGVYDVENEEVQWLGSDDFVEYPSCFLPDGKDVLGIRMKEAEREPVILKRDGSVKELELKDGVCSFPRYRRPRYGRKSIFTSSDSFILAFSNSKERKELLEYDLKDDTYQVLLESEYGDIGPDSFVESEHITYESKDGLSIGALLYHSGERPSPAVVMVHGGPYSQAMKRFDLYTQFLVSRGYTVLKPNYRGSIGRGSEFKKEIQMDYGGKEQEDIVNGARWLKEREWIDEDRIAVFGGSFGGYSVYMQMVKYPELWRTGIAWAGMTDLQKWYEEVIPAFQFDMEYSMGDPEENHELWRERSPIEHVGNMERPILMIHGVNDPRCPVEQARTFRDALEDMGWEEGEDFEYEELGEEGHGSTDIDQKIRTFKILENYLERRL